MITPCELPCEALLRRYRDTGAYTDGYCVDVPGVVTQADYVAAFYTTWVFKLERMLLTWLVAKPSNDRQAVELGHGERDAFAAWYVEDRTPDQLLMCDFRHRTRSWLMSGPVGPARSRLWFGSAVVAGVDPRSGRATIGATYRALLGFHRCYSRVLLRAAAARLARARRAAPGVD